MPRRRKKSDSATYWHDRAIQLTQKQLEEDTNLVETFSEEYMRLKFDLEKELAVFYQRYADNEGISMAEARKLLKGAELKNFRMGLDEFREKAIQGGFEKELDEVYLRSRVSRLQALQAQLDMHAKALYSEQEQTLTEHLGARYKDTYYRTVYAISQQNTIASTFAHVDRETLDKVLSSPWLEDNFSGRIWENRDKLIRELRQTLSRGIVRGDSLDEMTKALAKQMDTAESRAATLVHTESAHIAAEASLAGYKETGIQRYTFDATLDSKTCSYCGQMDQLQFPLSEQETGVNYPPLHPRCRCTTLPVTGFQIGSKRAARNPKTGKTEYVEKGLTYEEWRKKYVEKDVKASATVAEPSKSATIKPKIAENGDAAVKTIGTIDAEKFKPIAKNIRGTEVVLTERQAAHIKERRGEKFFEEYSKYFEEIVHDPEYIFKDDAHENTALACKCIEAKGKSVNLVIRLAVSQDEKGRKHSIITAVIESKKRFKQRLRNHVPVYEKK